MATIVTIALELALPGLLLLLWRSAERADREISALAQKRCTDPALRATHIMRQPRP